jgi:bifunctional non-homologous end joining protein LigD
MWASEPGLSAGGSPARGRGGTREGHPRMGPVPAGVLLQAIEGKDKLVFAGRVGSGFTDKDRRDYYKLLEKLERKSSALALVPKERI